MSGLFSLIRREEIRAGRVHLPRWNIRRGKRAVGVKLDYYCWPCTANPWGQMKSIKDVLENDGQRARLSPRAGVWICS